MDRFTRFVIPILTATPWGCHDYIRPRNPVSSLPRPTPVVPVLGNSRPGSNSAADKPGAQNDQAKRYVFLVRIKVVTIEAPVGTVSGSERVWSWLDEELVGAEALVNLGRNGFRIGAGRRDDWPAVAKMLKALTGHGLTQTLLMTTPREPVSYVVKQRQGIQTIFTFYPNRTCSGADYPPGDNLLTMACTFDPDEPQKLMITGVPQIRTIRHRPQIVKGRDRLSIVEKPAVFTFDPLTFRLRFTGGDFVMIGPGVQAARPVSVGHHFLIQRRKGVPFETVLILIPEVVAAPLRERAPAAGSLRPAAKPGG